MTDSLRRAQKAQEAAQERDRDSYQDDPDWASEDELQALRQAEEALAWESFVANHLFVRNHPWMMTGEG